jgi:ubiquilin
MGGEGDHLQQHEGSEEASGVGNASAATVIHIRCTNGSKFSVETDLEAKVGVFKVLLAEKCDIPADQQRLIYKGRILKDDNSLHSYGTFPLSLFLSLVWYY